MRVPADILARWAAAEATAPGAQLRAEVCDDDDAPGALWIIEWDRSLTEDEKRRLTQLFSRMGLDAT